MRRTVLVSLLFAVCAAGVPAAADPWAGYSVRRGHAFELFQRDGAPVEAQMFGGGGEDVLNSHPQPPEGEPCTYVYLFRANEGDEGCGTLEVVADQLLDRTTVRGTIESTHFTFDPETITFFYVGPSTIHVDLVLRGTGDVRRQHSENTGPGTCGLGTEIRGVLFMGEVILERDVAPEGTLTSAALGPVAPSTLTGEIRQAIHASGGACV